jgi:hypothetical protein
MIYVVEIAGPNGGRAAKEYEAPTIEAAIIAAGIDLRGFPQCEIVNIHTREGEGIPISIDPW